jgi:hypothetical protein
MRCAVFVHLEHHAADMSIPNYSHSHECPAQHHIASRPLCVHANRALAYGVRLDIVYARGGIILLGISRGPSRA